MGDHLVVRVDGREYGIPMSTIREVTSVRPPTMVPGLPDYIRGVVLFDERLTPVVDPARFMNGRLLEISARSCLVFVEGDPVSALLIDDIVGVVDEAFEQELQILIVPSSKGNAV